MGGRWHVEGSLLILTICQIVKISKLPSTCQLIHCELELSFQFATADLTKVQDDITSLYTCKRGKHIIGDSEIRWAKKRNSEGQRQLVIKYGDRSTNNAVIQEKDIPSLAAALLNYM